jgi:hypothetical protein
MQYYQPNPALQLTWPSVGVFVVKFFGDRYFILDLILRIRPSN